MIQHSENFSLQKYNSFGIDVSTRQFIDIDSIDDLKYFVKRGIPDKHLIIGEGSNLLFRKDYEGTVIHPGIRGVKKRREDELFVEIESSSGENWDSFVDFCCRNNYAGLENLSLIPGSVGSAPVQNIGAYGVEVKERIIWVEGVDTDNGEIRRIYNKDCGFGYRNSIFKQELKGKFIISSVLFRLDKHPRFVLNYGNLRDNFNAREKKNLLGLRECIIEIRKSKLPDPGKTGNAGSFFKNPVISPVLFSELKNKFPDIPSFPSGEEIKVPAAWLIDKAGWRGIREKDTGTWPNQPLVIVNYGNARGEEIYQFSIKIQKAIKDKFGIELEREVKVV